MTYDREIIKMDIDQLEASHKRLMIVYQ
jgi:hypothetical protein